MLLGKQSYSVSKLLYLKFLTNNARGGKQKTFKTIVTFSIATDKKLLTTYGNGLGNRGSRFLNFLDFQFLTVCN
jgi:hypothetical protein